MTSRRAVAAVVLAVVLAGCTAPSAPTDGPETDPGNESDGIRVLTADGQPASPGRLPVDPDLTFRRVQDILDSNVSPPGSIEVLRPSALGGGSGGSVPRFWTMVGVDSAPLRAANGSSTLAINGFTSPLGGVTLVYGNGTQPASVEFVLAHEYVHFVQFSEKRLTALNERLNTRTTDETYVVRSVIEGQAVFATEAYIRRHVAANVSNAALYREVRRRTRPGSVQRYRNSPYVVGEAYVASRIEDPDRIDRVYRDPPTTSEQVIHRLPPGAEPPRNLSVTIAESGAWEPSGYDRMGEAFLRVALRNGLPEARADRAAAGWGNDELRTVRPRNGSGNTSYVWILRWDDAANASEFESAFADYLDARGYRTGGRWTVEGAAFDLRSVDSTTTAVLAGDRRLVENASVEGTDGRVRIALPNGTANGDQQHARGNQSATADDRPAASG